VVRPRWTEGDQRLRFFVGNGAFEHTALDPRRRHLEDPGDQWLRH
jgi:hypothetical protein